MSAQDRSPRNRPALPPVGDGGNQGAPASSMPSTKQSRATADRNPAGAAPGGVPAPGQARAGSAVEAARTMPTVRRAGRSTARARRSRGVPNGGHRFRRRLAIRPAQHRGEFPLAGQARAGSAVEAARTMPTAGAQVASPREPGGPAASRTEGIASDADRKLARRSTEGSSRFTARPRRPLGVPERKASSPALVRMTHTTPTPRQST